MTIQFEVYEELQKADIILGLKWLEQLKPYIMESTQLMITYNSEMILIPRVLT